MKFFGNIPFRVSSPSIIPNWRSEGFNWCSLKIFVNKLNDSPNIEQLLSDSRLIHCKSVTVYHCVWNTLALYKLKIGTHPPRVVYLLYNHDNISYLETQLINIISFTVVHCLGKGVMTYAYYILTETYC